jgi:hypothetical protein
MERYSRLPIIKDFETKIPRFINVKYPSIPVSSLDIYIFITQGDRYDTLALTFYKDSSLWWIISQGNPTQPSDSLYPKVGSQLRVPSPSSISQIISSYETINGI